MTCMTPACRRAGRDARPGSQWCQTCAERVAGTILKGYHGLVDSGVSPGQARREVSR